MTHRTFTLGELPHGSPNLYMAELEGETVGIGTADEFRDLLADGIFDLNDPIRFRLER